MGLSCQRASDADSPVWAITLPGKFVKGGKPTGSVRDQTGKPPETKSKHISWLMVFPVVRRYLVAG